MEELVLVFSRTQPSWHLLNSSPPLCISLVVLGACNCLYLGPRWRRYIIRVKNYVQPTSLARTCRAITFCLDARHSTGFAQSLSGSHALTHLRLQEFITIGTMKPVQSIKKTAHNKEGCFHHLHPGESSEDSRGHPNHAAPCKFER